MMLEKVKTALLTLFVCMSIFLTWQIWAYQPEYDYINPTEYVEHEGLSKKREAKDLLRSDKIIYHLGEVKHAVAYPQAFQYRVIKGQMPNWYFYEFSTVAADEYQKWQEALKQVQGIEISFSAALPFSLIQENIQIKAENFELPLINRIWIYQEEDSRSVSAMFISEEEQKLVRARTNLSVDELNTYLVLGEMLPLHRAYNFSDPQKNEVYDFHYLSTETTEIEEYRYFYRMIPVDTMIQYLFVDPSLVRHIQDQEGTGFYTDGSRGLQYGLNQQTMYYFHPVVRNIQTEEQSEQYVQKSIQFVNQHQGFDQTYYLYDIQRDTFEQKETVQFRKYIGNYPVFSVSEKADHNVIQLEVQWDQIIGYYRPLIEIDRVIEQGKVELPAGEKVVQLLEDKGMDPAQIKYMTIGYRIEIKDYYLQYVPSWVIDMKNNDRLFIEQIPDDLKEDLNDELE